MSKVKLSDFMRVTGLGDLAGRPLLSGIFLVVISVTGSGDPRDIFPLEG
jgi:hypothetical protein